MTMLDLFIVFGIVLIIIGIVRRKRNQGKWLLAAGIVITILGFGLLGYGDIKEGFFDALND